MADPLDWRWRGRLPYAATLVEQRERRSAILAGSAPEEIWLLEHAPVITVGRRGAEGIAPDAVLAQRGVSVVRTERGGLATWHGPGQLVAYLLVNAVERGWGVRRLVHAVEQAVIDLLAALGVAAARRAGLPGVWVGADKIAAIGLHVRRGVTMHGLAVNLAPDLSWYDLFVPCGVTDGGVTSVARAGGRALDLEAAAALLGPILVDRLHSGRPSSTAAP